MFHILSIVLGVLIAVMLTINSQFSLILGNLQSALIIHLVGLGILLPVLFLAGKRAKREGVPLYLLTAGVIGVVLIFSNNICFNNIGASLSISLIILGQTLTGQIIDVTGFLGMEKHPFHKKKLFGWILVIAGALVMTGGSSGSVIYLLLALASGALVMLSTVINAQLARRVGLLRGTSINYAAGLIAVLVLLLIMGSRPSNFAVLPSIHPLLIFGGGALGVIIVSGLSTVIPRIPAVYSTILIFIGQVGAGLVLDYYILDSFAWLQAIGAVIIALGLLVKVLVDLKEQNKAAAPAVAAA